MPQTRYKKKVLLLLAEGFELIETSCFTDVLAWASFQEHVDISMISCSRAEAVKTAFGGFKMTPDVTIQQLNLNDYDGLAIPGGMEWAGFFDDALSEDFTTVIQHFANAKKPIAAVCVASIAIANAEVLSGRNATIYHSSTGKHKANLERLGVNFIDKPIVQDGSFITSTGPGTAVEVALALLGQLTDDETVAVTRSMMRVPKPHESWYQPQV